MDPLLATALEAAEAAARVHLHYFGAFQVEDAREKSKSDYVTAVDLEAQAAAVGVVRARFPEHLILAEEEDGEGAAAAETAVEAASPRDQEEKAVAQVRRWPEDGTPLWIIDPLDGTTNYLHRHPMFGASVGVGAAGVFEAGAVVAARTGERWWARRGGGAFKDGRPIRVSSIRNLRDALVGTGFPFKEPELVPRYVSQLGRILLASGGVRRGGSAALDLCYLAEGVLDAFWEEDYLSPWDVAAGLVILSEAGGVATRLDGSELDLENGSVLGANSAEVKESLSRVLQDS
jgi:myo-inositol-1(or 4)-monophosphatase